MFVQLFGATAAAARGGGWRAIADDSRAYGSGLATRKPAGACRALASPSAVPSPSPSLYVLDASAAVQAE